jgi:hypothetical protein
MSAHLHIHVLRDVTEADLAVFFSNSIGSKWFDPKPTGKMDFDLVEKIEQSPNIEVGPVSWLKAGLLEDDSFIPEPIGLLVDIIGEELPVIDQTLLDQVEEALKTTNTSVYNLENLDNVLEFLKKHRGERIFTVSW